MTVGELFVNIGIKGAETVSKSLGAVSQGMTDLASNSLVAKAAIVAALYGAERFMAGAAQAGTSLHNYTALTGESAVKLQQWQEAARRSGEAAEQMSSDMVAAQKTMVDMQLGTGGPPGGLAFISKYVKGFDQNQIKDPDYVMRKLREFAQNAQLPESVKTSFLGKMGISDATIVTLKSFRGELEKIDRFYISSQKEVDQLNRINIAWSTIGKNLQMYQRHFVANHGLFMVSEISHAIHELLKLSDAFSKLADQVPALKYLSLAIAGIAGLTFAPLTTSIIALTAILADLDKGKKGYIGKSIEWMHRYDDGFIKFLNPMLGNKAAHDLDTVNEVMKTVTDSILAGFASKPVDSKQNSDVNITQNITHYGDAKDTKAVGDTHKQSIRAAGALLQGLGH